MHYGEKKPHDVLIIAIIVFIMGQIIPWNDSEYYHIRHMRKSD